MPRSWPPRACLPDRRENLSHSMRPATIQPPKVAIQWITLPLSSVGMLSFAVFASCQPVRNAAVQIPRLRRPSYKCFVPYHIHVSTAFSDDCALFYAAGIRFLPCFQLLAHSFHVDRGWGVSFP